MVTRAPCNWITMGASLMYRVWSYLLIRRRSMRKNELTKTRTTTDDRYQDGASVQRKTSNDVAVLPYSHGMLQRKYLSTFLLIFSCRKEAAIDDSSYRIRSSDTKNSLDLPLYRVSASPTENRKMFVTASNQSTVYLLASAHLLRKVDFAY